jgi:hypothetical protein
MKGKPMSKNVLELYKIGSRVKLTKDLYGSIVGIHINGDNNIVYECGWWDGNSYSLHNFSSNEIELNDGEKTKIGFI